MTSTSPKLDRSVGVALALGTVALAAVPPYNFETNKLLSYAAPAAATCIALLALARRGPGHVRLGTLPLFLILVAVATSWHQDPNAWRHYAVFAGVLMSFTALGSVAHERDLRIWVRAVVGVATLEAAYAIWESATQAQPLMAYPLMFHDVGEQLVNSMFPPLYRAQGTFGHPLPLSLFLLVAFGLVITGRTRKRPFVALCCAVGLLAGMAVSGSRSSLIIAVLAFIATRARRTSRWVVGGYLSAWLLALLWAVGFFTSSLVGNFFSSGSYTHRMGSLEAIGTLWTGRPILEVFFGSGYWSTQRLTELGLVNVDGFSAIDNQWVSIFAVAGLLGVGLFVAWLWPALRWESGYRVPLLMMVGMFFSFDMLLWPSSLGLLAVLIGIGYRSASRDGGPAGIPGAAALDVEQRSCRARAVDAEAADVGRHDALR